MRHYHCPMNAVDCPYYTDKGHPCRCLLTDPYEECDDFYFHWGDDVERHEFTDHDWKPCETCIHNGDETLEDVSSCACCEVGEFYDSENSKYLYVTRKVVRIIEENHGTIGVASNFNKAKQWILDNDWFNEYSEVHNDETGEWVNVKEFFGENWKEEFLRQNEDFFDGMFYFQKIDFAE